MQTIQQLIQAIEKTPNDPGLHYELGGLYLESHNTQAALISYQNALQLAPNHPQILLQLGNTASAAQQYEQAIQYFQQCLQTGASNAAAYYNLGNAYMVLGQSNHAVTQFRQSLKYHPNDADAYNNLGNALRDLGKLDEAIDCYTQALAINPHLHHALVHRIHQQQHICNWQGLNDDIARLRNVLKSDPKAQITPFAFLAMPNTSAEEQLLCASQWAQQQFGHLQALPAIGTRKTNTKIKVAYLSADFRLHPLAFLISELLAAHDRTRFEIHAYSYGPDDNSYERQQIEANVDHFVDIRQLTDQQAAEHMRAQAIDILVDLTGYTKHSRTSIVALKPAPISINWLGYPGTMGYLDTMGGAQHHSVFDYILVDHTIAPNSENYSETCLYLPCYQPNNAQRPIGETPSKSALGIPKGAFVFCCFNQTFKITEEIFTVWMQLLNQTSNSVLWLLECNQWAKKNLLAYAQQAGVAPERILFAPRVPIQDHLARHVHADLFLDTLPYNAHTTASDALWMNVPVLTCIGDTFPSRVAASLLTSLNLQSLVTHSLQDYAARALTLAQDKTALDEIKQHLQTHKSKLFNPKLFVQGLESAYIHVYNKIP
jgi:protein O-GlcNAc transferase